MKTDDVPPQLLDTAIFGKQVENFLNTELGKYLVGRAEAQAERAHEQLARVLPWRRRRIQQLQNEIWLAERFQQWLAEAIMDGEQAVNLIEEDHG